MQNLLQKSIKKDHLGDIQYILEDFVKEANELYGNSIMLAGLHETMHLVECTLDFGPLNYTNAIPFEEINRKIMKFIHG